MGSWERFRVRDAGGGNMALHNDQHNCFLRMSDRTMDPGGVGSGIFQIGFDLRLDTE